ncbi:uncharacterized protein involved in exopolysaccharide biosynthesis [Rhodoblastus acidophilus]|uniref:hypothetical protein n=1 Tax=Rhodoblastus acidophilus TaxID=1074 RepID=UPI001614F59F|nr:hypothetical protein [Rhodoblastus acidophilus]MCW2282931.1 uncharacterized protein involved in exopolysaccharide biosynthesis [Rhodoblastus acidophilus]MCW2331792.1 uncharacterized protein involved in exopolysaccharide biosynthesis [Rhodoblastus acidophilus]
MKISQALAPAVVLLAFGVGVGTAFLVQRTATAEPNAQQTVQIDSSSVSAICEDREVEMDEGYAITRKEKRRVCH